MSKTTEHTKTTTPWAIKQGAWKSHIVCGATGETIAEVSSYSDNEEANAAFIVKACNSHEALVEALAGLIQECQYSATSGLPFNYPDNQGQWTQLEQARAALAKTTSEA